MAATPESRVKSKIKDFLKTVPKCWWFMPIGGPYSRQGIPDIIGHVDGKFFAIEVKAPGKRSNLTELQKVEIVKISVNGGVVMVACDVNEVRNAFIMQGFVSTP